MTEESGTGRGRGTDTERGRGERYAPLVAGVVLAIPSVVAHYLPMSDLALHEGVVGILRHYGDDAYFPRELYALNLGHSNQLFHLLSWALSYVVGTRWAVKLVVALAQFMIFWAGARFADHTGRSRWSVLLLAPLALGFTYYWGLVANLLGFAAFLFVLPFMDRAAESPSWKSMGRVCGLFMLLFVAHGSAFVAAAGFVGTLAVVHPYDPRDRRTTALRFVPVAFAATFMVAYFFWSRTFLTRGQITPPAVFPPLTEKIFFIPNILFGSHELYAQLMLLGISLTAATVLLVERVREERGHPSAPKPAGRLGRARAALLAYRFEATGIAFLIAYAVSPFQFNGATLIYERFLGPAWALFMICAAPRGDAPRIAKLTASVVPVAILLLAWPQFVDSDRTYTNLDSVIAEIPKRSAVALVSVDRPVYRTRVYSASVGPARSVADRGGRAMLSLVISPLSPVQIRPEYRWDELDIRTLVHGSRALRPTHDLRRFGWIIAQSREIAVREILIEAFKPDAEHVLTRGEWLLFKSTHEQVPLTSPDDPPDPRLETILDRVNRLAKARYEEQVRRQLEEGQPPR